MPESPSRGPRQRAYTPHRHIIYPLATAFPSWSCGYTYKRHMAEKKCTLDIVDSVCVYMSCFTANRLKITEALMEFFKYLIQ